MAEPDLDALAATCEAATPGPWERHQERRRRRHRQGGVICGPTDQADYITTFDPPTVAALIAKARRAEALEAENEKLREGLRGVVAVLDRRSGGSEPMLPAARALLAAVTSDGEVDR